MAETYNWHSYEVLAHGEFGVDDVAVVLEANNRETNAIVDEVIEQCWQDANKGRIGVGLLPLRPSTVYRLNYHQLEDTLLLSLGETAFKELQGTNATNWILGKVYGPNFLANGLLVQTIVKTEEGLQVLGKRNSRVKEGFETVAIFGGAVEKDEIVVTSSAQLFEMAIIELKQELGILDEDIADIKLIALYRDWKFYPVLLFKVLLKSNKQQTQERFDQRGALDEHVGIVFYEDEELAASAKVTPEKFSDLTLASEEIYLQKKV